MGVLNLQRLCVLMVQGHENVVDSVTSLMTLLMMMIKENFCFQVKIRLVYNSLSNFIAKMSVSYDETTGNAEKGGIKTCLSEWIQLRGWAVCQTVDIIVS